MVMHARKIPRINDGFTEKHQSHNAYESTKYTSSSSGGGGGSGGSGGSKYRTGVPAALASYADKRLDSPSTNSLRSSSPDSRSQSPRYHKSSSGGTNYYKREAYRDREFSSRDYRENRDGSRSPKERRRDGRERNSEHVSRSSTLKKESSTSSGSGGSQQYRVGDWSEHVSSSGKRYYYNCRTEVSQWEKPGDWLDWEQQHGGRHPSSSSSKPSQLHSAYNNQHNSSSSSSSTKGPSYNSSSLTSSSNSSSSSKVSYNNLANHPNSKPNSNYSSHSGSTNNSVSTSYNSSKSAYSGSTAPGSSNLCKGSSSSLIMNNSSTLAPTNLQHSLSLASSSSSSTSTSHHHQHNQPHHHHHHASGTNSTLASSGSNSGIKDSSVPSSGQHLRPTLGHDKTKLDKHSSLDGVRDHSYRAAEDPHDKRDLRKYQTSGQDMDISSGGSTPTSESVHGRNKHLHPHPNSNSVSTPSPLLLPATCLASNHHSHLHHATTTSNHPRLGPYPNTNTTTTSNSCVSLADVRLHPFVNSSGSSTTSINNSSDVPYSNSIGGCNSNNSSTIKSHGDVLTINTSSGGMGGQGPPTPTHSETHDNSDPRKDASGSTASCRVPTSVHNSSNLGAGGVSLSSLSQPGTSGSPWSSSLSSSLSSQRPSHPLPALTPSLTNYYNETLISHVRDWPAENVEKQSQRLSEEAHTMGSLLMTKVSADLKMARSLVRLAEIQATLHEQRILFLRAQKRELEEMSLKSQHSFLSDSGGNS